VSSKENARLARITFGKTFRAKSFIGLGFLSRSEYLEVTDCTRKTSVPGRDGRNSQPQITGCVEDRRLLPGCQGPSNGGFVSSGDAAGKTGFPGFGAALQFVLRQTVLFAFARESFVEDLLVGLQHPPKALQAGETPNTRPRS